MLKQQVQLQTPTYKSLLAIPREQLRLLEERAVTARMGSLAVLAEPVPSVELAARAAQRAQVALRTPVDLSDLMERLLVLVGELLKPHHTQREMLIQQVAKLVLRAQEAQAVRAVAAQRQRPRQEARAAPQVREALHMREDLLRITQRLELF